MLGIFNNFITYLPHTKEYDDFLKSLFSSQASLAKPSIIICPRTDSEVKEFVRLANQYKLPFTVCDGGLSSGSVKNNLICLALNQFYNDVSIIKTETEYELDLAYKDELTNLRQLAKICDKQQLLANYPL